MITNYLSYSVPVYSMRQSRGAPYYAISRVLDNIVDNITQTRKQTEVVY